MSYRQGQIDALMKLGYDLDDAAKVLRASKKYVLPKRENLEYVRGAGRAGWNIPLGAVTVPSESIAKKRTKMFEGIKNKLVHPGADIPIDVQIQDTSKLLLPANDPSRSPAYRDLDSVMRPKVVVRNPDLGNFLQDASATKPITYMRPAPGQPFKPVYPTKKQLSGREHKMLHSIAKGHEIDEATVAPTMAFQTFGHESPDVLLREHNRIATMPEEFKNVKNIMQNLRRENEGFELFNTLGLNYGEGPRLSRHARKHMTRLMDEEYLALRNAPQPGAAMRAKTEKHLDYTMRKDNEAARQIMRAKKEGKLP